MRFKSAFFNELYIYFISLPKSLTGNFQFAQTLIKKKHLFHKIVKDEELLIVNSDFAKYISCIKQRKNVTIFNSPFEDKYLRVKPQIEYDYKSGLKYIIHDAKRLYYPSHYKNSFIERSFRSICCEQDDDSPHRYADIGESFKGSILLDCGTAEGNFPFEIIGDLKAAYLIEGDPAWIKALNATFEPWKDKVTIVNKYLGKKEKDLSLKKFLESLVDDGELDFTDDLFIKMDIEGCEPTVMEDIFSIIKSFQKIRIAICVYHNMTDEETIRKFIPEGFTARVRPGYMLFYYQKNNIPFPYFSHGIMRVDKYAE